jgi:hypothetical protein
MAAVEGGREVKAARDRSSLYTNLEQGILIVVRREF